MCGRLALPRRSLCQPCDRIHAIPQRQRIQSHHQRDKERRTIEEGEGERGRKGSAYACTSQSPACQRIQPPRLPACQPSPWRITCRHDAFKGIIINDRNGLTPSPRLGSSQQGAGDRGSAAAQSLSGFVISKFTVPIPQFLGGREPDVSRASSQDACHGWQGQGHRKSVLLRGHG